VGVRYRWRVVCRWHRERRVSAGKQGEALGRDGLDGPLPIILGHQSNKRHHQCVPRSIQLVSIRLNGSLLLSPIAS
jgi:hypothetical protein